MAKRRLVMEVGRLAKNEVITDIRKTAFVAGVTCSIEEDMGWIDGYLYITLSGDSTAVAQVTSAMRKQYGKEAA